ncbi:MAG: PPC domain-containing protein [Nostoc sp. ChiQUE02]|uniref:PPC domain-containing protein n=1 Tax=Nostoc sp. ChiQUE02 TaxID=3075377 RepID=UPI002AD1FF38|nr:PPC domain-containing protein [Nostoc sp. ChiQUE02]MDZ8229852.1 PPC domain-containing protein [Nostoc sp. ChiQUE02]
MALFNLGTLGSTPVVKSNFTLSTTDPTDVFQFKITSGKNINLSLTDISAGDDADIRLFRDANNNGVLDNFDRISGLVSNRGSNQDDAINFKTSSGTFFAEVSRFAPGSSGTVGYDLALSATAPSGTFPLSASFSNLLPKEFVLGNLSGDVTRFGNISNTNTADVYSFSLGTFEGVNIKLDGLSTDADIRLIRDFNNNRIVDAGEEIASSTKSGITSELISNINLSGDYFLQVTEFSGNTNYKVTFDHFTTPFA